MIFKLKKIVCGISSIAMISSMGVTSIFADELATIGESSTAEVILNDFNKPLMEDGVHGDTNIVDMEYIHYELSDIQDTLTAVCNLSEAEYTSENLELLFNLEYELDNFFYKVSNSYSLIYLYYNQEPTAENLIEYTYTTSFYQNYINEYNNAMKTVMSGSFGTSLLEELEYLSNIDATYSSIYLYYYSFLISGTINEETQAVQTKINDKLNEYFALIQTDISNEEVLYNDVSMTYGDLLSNYVTLYSELTSNYADISEIPEDKLNEYYSMEETLRVTKQIYGVDNDTLNQLYIDIVNLYNEYAQTVGYSNYIDLSYSYDLDEINQITSDVKEYVIPVLEDYQNKVNDNPLFEEVNSLEFTVDEGKELSNAVISSVGKEYVDIYNYMDQHGLLVLDEDYSYPMGYTTSLPEYSQAYIYLTFENSNIFDWFTNGITHEFGHFIDWYNNLEGFARSSMATAENVSVSFSYICNDNLDAYFDETTSNALAISNVLNNSYTYLNSTLSMNEFELYAFQNADTITVDGLNKKYLDVCKDYTLIDNIAYQLGNAKEFGNFSLYSQIYTTPFYMVDYSMAGLSALTVFDTYMKDNQAGLELFDKLYSNDYYYSDYVTMMNNGLGIDIYADDYVKNVANTLDSYLSDKFKQISEVTYQLGDVNLDGNVSSADLLILKKSLLGLDLSNVEIDISMGDINQDGNVNTADLLRLKKILLGLV